jgi:hypothetical protein
MGEKYWEDFQLQEKDIEFLYNLLLELETPLTSQELLTALVEERVQQQKNEIEKQRMSGGSLYQPKGTFQIKEQLIFPALNWKHGEVVNLRPGRNPDLGEFQVIQVAFEDGSQREFAAGLADHKLNEPPKIIEDHNQLDQQTVLRLYFDDLVEALEEGLRQHPDFVRIAGKWFPRALLININIGHLNLAEAALDMAGGGPLTTAKLLEQIGISTNANPKLVEFSLDLALQEDGRFDEVGPSGDVLWYLRRLEPAEVLEPPLFLRYQGIDYDRTLLTKEMLALEQELDDELSPLEVGKNQQSDDVQVRLIFPHWRSGTLPLASRVRHLFPTAYEAPRIQFTLVDGDSGEQFSAWVVREKRYVHGLKEWYQAHGVMPGSIIHVRKGKRSGEVVLHVDNKRPSREWVRTVLVGSDGGIVFAMLKQVVSTPVDDRMAIAIPDKDALDQAWMQHTKNQASFERTVLMCVKELAKLNPQSHVHATELYAALNVIRRCPPGPILAHLTTQPKYLHVGDMHYRLGDVDLD